MPKSAGDIRKTQGLCRHIRVLHVTGSKKLLLADYEYEAGKQKYYKSISFKLQKERDGTYFISYPERITVFYDEKHPRFSCWERNSQQKDLVYILKTNEKARKTT